MYIRMSSGGNNYQFEIDDLWEGHNEFTLHQVMHSVHRGMAEFNKRQSQWDVEKHQLMALLHKFACTSLEASEVVRQGLNAIYADKNPDWQRPDPFPPSPRRG